MPTAIESGNRVHFQIPLSVVPTIRKWILLDEMASFLGLLDLPLLMVSLCKFINRVCRYIVTAVIYLCYGPKRYKELLLILLLKDFLQLNYCSSFTINGQKHNIQSFIDLVSQVSSIYPRPKDTDLKIHIDLEGFSHQSSTSKNKSNYYVFPLTNYPVPMICRMIRCGRILDMNPSHHHSSTFLYYYHTMQELKPRSVSPPVKTLMKTPTHFI